MTERKISSDYRVRGRIYELWCDKHHNWYLVEDGKDVDSAKLTVAEQEAISQFVEEKLAPQ